MPRFDGLTQRGRAATVVVAASNSLYPNSADYVCDGTDDQVEIQAAIDALPTAGGIVQLTEGTFNVNQADSLSHAINLANYTWLRGAGEYATIINLTEDFSDHLLKLSTTNAIVSDLTLDTSFVADGTRNFITIYGESGSYNLVRNVFFNEPDQIAISLLNQTHTWVEDCRFLGNSAAANATDTMIYIRGSSSSDLYVCHNIFQHIQRWGILAENAWENLIVEGNVFQDIDEEHGIYCQVEDAVIVGNIFKTIGGSAVRFRLAGTGDTRMIVANNEMINCAQVGGEWVMYGGNSGVDSPDKVIIEGNQIRGGANGITVRGATGLLISDNYIQGITVSGIVPVGVSDAVIKGNIVDGCANGIYIYYAGAGWGVCNRLLLDGNYLLNNSGYGLVVDNNAHDKIHEHGNAYYNNTTGVRSIGGSVTNHTQADNVEW